MSDRGLRELERRVAIGEVAPGVLAQRRISLGLCHACGSKHDGACIADYVDRASLPSSKWARSNVALHGKYPSWRDKVRPYVAEVLRRCPAGSSKEDRIAVLKRNRPSEVTGHDGWIRKVWYSEVSRQLAGQEPVRGRKLAVLPGQVDLFGGEE